eukprot:CAMPEP_0183710888 /NCGR_PEP_ID=MMETSP0737-20130205/6514_1 /TAXON_ID=385413 /ORGANISM="Thalassiosira miniscula, Strain CCMP1093" /LENGTH=236 /DNA_ID=CAMNT_0025939255 /DNA_START=110 /DNA_END=820 /DNA_ORIENTATION=+
MVCCKNVSFAFVAAAICILLALRSVPADSWAMDQGRTRHPLDQSNTKMMSRSNLLHTVASSAILIASQPNPAHGAMYDNGPDMSGMLPPTSLPSGVTYQDLRQGPPSSSSGSDVTIQEGMRVNVQWSLKRTNGYSVDSSANNDGVPFIFTVGDTSPKGAIPGLDEGIRGARLGTIRRIVMPPELAYVDGVEDDCRGPLPVGFGPRQRIRRVMSLLKDVPGEGILLDVKVTRIQAAS